jgi:hypothetical protein
MQVEKGLQLIIIGLIIILPLAYYAWKLRHQVSKIRAAEQQDKALADRAFQQQRSEALTSIHVIATGALQNEVNLSEASIRIAALIDSMTTQDELKQPFMSIYTLAAATYNIPRNKAWKGLNHKQRDRHRDDMAKLEHQHKAAISTELQLICHQIAADNFLKD